MGTGGPYTSKQIKRWKRDHKRWDRKAKVKRVKKCLYGVFFQ